MVDTSAVVKIGATIDESTDDELHVTVLAAGFPDTIYKPDAQEKQRPVTVRETTYDGDSQAASIPVSFGSDRTTKPMQVPDQDTDELDIPAFLRRK